MNPWAGLIRLILTVRRDTSRVGVWENFLARPPNRSAVWATPDGVEVGREGNRAPGQRAWHDEIPFFASA